MKIYLVRHGESVDDIEDCYGGIADFSLTEAGQKTAEKLADKLKDSEIKILYTSPYKRAFETAEIISKSLNCEIKTIQALRERNSYGVLSGVNKAKSKEIFSNIFQNLKGKPGDYYADESVPGDEPKNLFNQRVQSAFDEVIKDADGVDTIGIVTHGNVTRSIYKNILGVKGKVGLDLLAITIINYELSTIRIEDSQGVDVHS